MERTKKVKVIPMRCNYDESFICVKMSRGMPYDCYTCNHYSSNKKKEEIDLTKEFERCKAYFEDHTHLFTDNTFEFLISILEYYYIESMSIKQAEAFIRTVGVVMKNEDRFIRMYEKRNKLKR